MSDNNKSKLQTWISENIVVFIIGVILTGLSWGNRMQLDSIKVGQEKAILQAQAQADDRFVAKTLFQAEDSSLRVADAANAAAVANVASAVSDIKTSIAVLTAEVQRQGQHPFKP